MGEASGSDRARRVIVPVAAIVVMLIAIGLGVAWTAAATGDRPGTEVDVTPVIGGVQLESPAPSPTPTPTPPPEAPSVPAPAPQPVPAPPPADIDDDDDDDDDDGGDD
jgi:hypothetical protein